MFFCFFSAPVYGKGKTEEKEPVSHNGQWVLAVTAFDISSLEPSRRIIGDMISRSFVASLNSVDRHIRISREYAYYEHYAWAQARAAAAKSLAAKRGERDLLLFRGDPDWKYRNNVKTIDGDIAKLEEALKKTEAEMPLIANEPVLQIIEDNLNGVFPEPPKKGEEYLFCRNQKADALITGTVSEYYGRIHVSLQIYTIYARSFFYEDSVIFSYEDTLRVMGELADRLVAVISGTVPAAIAVHAEPQDAVILVKESFAGRGEVPVREQPPGEVVVEAFAENYESVEVPVDLYAGELAELYINLRPRSRAALTVTVPGQTGSSLYQGALYIGQTPLVMDVFSNQLEYLRAETPGGETGSAVFKRDINLLGDAGSLELQTDLPAPPGSHPVETARKRLYGAYGRFWIALPVMFVAWGLSSAYQVNAASQGVTANIYNGVAWGFTGALGFTLAETFFRIYQYSRISGKNAAPIVK
ncbi:MAG: hypothetical protein LBP43_02710 [Treponema sp.]|nr:hypothetical protein [Treponema sp.]